MAGFSSDVLDAAAHQREVRLTTYGRKSGKLHDVTIWIGTDAKHLYIRSGQGMSRHWPQNLVARGAGLLHLGNLQVKVKPRLVTDPAEARSASAAWRWLWRRDTARHPRRPRVPRRRARRPDW